MLQKSKTLVLNWKENQQDTSITINRQNLQNVQSYPYLGREINKRLDHSRKISTEIARSDFRKMRSLLCLWSRLLYGCETWTVKQDDIKKINAFEMWLYRRMLRIIWTSITTIETVLNKMNTPTFNQ